MSRPREIAQYTLGGKRAGRTAEIYMMLMSTAVRAVDDGTDEFVALLVRPEGNVRITFRPETLKLQEPDSACHCFYSCNCRVHPARCYFPHKQYVYAQKPDV